MTARSVVRVEVGRRSAWLYGTGVWTACEATSTPKMMCPSMKTWTVPVDRLSDVLAYLEYRARRRVELLEVDR